MRNKESTSKLMQIAKWNSFRNPLSRVLGMESICDTITTRVAESLAGGISASMICVGEDFMYKKDVKNEYIGCEIRTDEGIRTFSDNCMGTLRTIDACGSKHIIEPKYRIRKLTPNECFRLMGVRDEDYENVAKNQSNASLYHLAGDSIVVDVLMNIFKQML